MDSECREEIIITEKKVIIKLLELYKDCPCLWNTSDSLYCNKDARNQAWQLLLEKWNQYYPHATISDLKKKIEHLRAAYRRERNKVEASKISGAGVADLHTPSLWYYEYLNFLHEKANVTSKRINNWETNSDNSNVEEPVIKKKKYSLKRKTSLYKKQEDLIKSGKQLIHNSSSGEETSADAFGHSVSSQLKELPKLQRCIAEKIIGEVLCYAKLGELTMDSSVNLNKNLYTNTHYSSI